MTRNSVRTARRPCRLQARPLGSLCAAWGVRVKWMCAIRLAGARPRATIGLESMTRNAAQLITVHGCLRSLHQRTRAMPRSANAASSLAMTSATVIRLIAAGSRTRWPHLSVSIGRPNSRATASGYLSTTRCWLKYCPGAKPVRGRVEPDDRGTDGRRHVGRAGVGTEHDTRARQNREQLLQRRLADQVPGLKAGRRRDVAAIGLLYL